MAEATEDTADLASQEEPEISAEDSAPAEETAAEEAPAAEADVQEEAAPVEETPAEESLAESAPAEDAPVAEEPVAEDTPASEEPAKEAEAESPADEAAAAPEPAKEKRITEEDVDMTQEIVVYHSSISCSPLIKKQQQAVLFVLSAKKYNVKLVDLACIGESAKAEMRKIADDPTCVPPQIAKGEEYCGGYDRFFEAVEDGQLLKFLKLTQ